MQPHFPVSSSSPDSSAFSAGLTSPLLTSPANAVMMAHTLFLDIVGFARLSPSAQVAAQERLNEIVRSVSIVRRAIALASPTTTGGAGADVTVQPTTSAATPRRRAPLFRPTGDGMAILFWNEACEPVACAREVAEALRLGDLPKFGPERFTNGKEPRPLQQLRPALRLRMGVHSGQVTLVRDVNGQEDVSGDGIIRAQRIMDLGDAEHILVSEATVLALGPLSPFARRLSDLGVCRIKHDMLLHVYNFYSATDEFAPWGNPAIPPCLSAQAAARITRDQHMRETWNRDADEERVRPFRASFAILVWSLFAVSATALILWQLAPVRSLMQEAFPRAASFRSASLPGYGKPNADPNGNDALNANKAGSTDTAARSVSGVTTAPDFTGEMFDVAERLAKAQRISLVKSFNYTYDITRPANEIDYQNPPAGADIPADRKIYVCLFRNVLPTQEDGDSGDEMPRRSFGEKPLARPRRQSGVAREGQEERHIVDLSHSASSPDAPPIAAGHAFDDDHFTASANGSTVAAPPAPLAAPAGDKGKSDALAAQNSGDGPKDMTGGKSDPAYDEPPWQ